MPCVELKNVVACGAGAPGSYGHPAPQIVS
jgi:hypothetical protein